MTTTLDPRAKHVVLINTFLVEPSRAEELLTILSRATVDGMQNLPGFVSANLHMSKDKTHVANYAQWRSQADLDAMMQNPAAKPHMQEAAEVATSFEPIVYELREAHGGTAT